MMVIVARGKDAILKISSALQGRAFAISITHVLHGNIAMIKQRTDASRAGIFVQAIVIAEHGKFAMG